MAFVVLVERPEKTAERRKVHDELDITGTDEAPRDDLARSLSKTLNRRERRAEWVLVVGGRFAVASDAQRFLFPFAPQLRDRPTITIVLNWAAAIKK